MIPYFKFLQKYCKCLIWGHKWKNWSRDGIYGFGGKYCTKCQRKTITYSSYPYAFPGYKNIGNPPNENKITKSSTF